MSADVGVTCRKMFFCVDCEAPFGQVSPIEGRATEFAAVLVDAPPFQNAFHWPKDGTIWEFAAWLKSHADRPVFVSDNPAYDWQWVAAEFARARIDNPFGFSARRIGDFSAGLKHNWHDANSWKRHRKTKHDHNPVNDARGNAEALWHLWEKAK